MPPPPKIKKARFVVERTFTADRMLQFGNSLVNSMKDRMFAGLDISDRPTPPLSPKYAERKARKYPPAERNMRRTGRTLRALQVLRASEGRAVVGMQDPVAIQRFNWQRFRFWGVSPRNFSDVLRDGDQILSGKVVEVKRIA